MVEYPSPSSALFQPVKIGTHQLQHRIVLAPLTRLRASPETRVPSPLAVEYYAQRTTPGGLLISEGTVISAESGGYPGSPGIWNVEQVEGWRKVTEAVHAKGGVIFSQISHIGRAASRLWMPNKTLPLAPSPIAIQGDAFFGGGPYEIPHALTVPEIKDVVQQHVIAAKRAIEAGFDGVEVHAANGYLLDEFINSSSNKRTDEYGGSIENRARIILETVEAVVKAIGEQRTGIRFSPWSDFQDMKDDTPYATWGYLTEQLQAKHPNLAYLHFIEPRDDMLVPDADLSKKAHLTLDPFRAIWRGAFISAGGYTTSPKLAGEVADKTGDLVAFGRSYIANPDLVLRLKHAWPLNPYDRSTFYTTSEAGYTDYPTSFALT
ncbi:hypothetical protein BCR43DRAFT_555630 [Syncephalastrum racemosum]|uniref:NADH:flavin oxidoreductase/NADH oxidase N-terminal domain-containing protein n=1 Tax=Syncephalastrum racemosum TaxID=13706 RepID=A0A1X2HL60_SYNRA|nr:hypothetical protein BCR43DRAFT_555630 [Syncephalastrum racemosum]